jgi:CDP-diacylglycerol--glycerol-3-phosphate 3-phosphatidyltransferase
MWALARPLRTVPPTVVTVVGVVLALDAALLARGHPAWAAAAVVGAALADGLDGAVAVVAGRATRLGAVADGIADRVADCAFAAVLWRVGVPFGVAAACAGLAVGMDVLRRVRRVPDRITVGERPSWTVCAALAAVCAAVSAAGWPERVCAGVWLALGVVALGQLALSRGPSTQGGHAGDRASRTR